MHVILRRMDICTNKTTVISLARNALIETLKQLIYDRSGIEPNNQRLFFAGKQVSFFLIFQ